MVVWYHAAPYLCNIKQKDMTERSEQWRIEYKKLLEIERKLAPVFKEVIETNNEVTIRKCLDYVPVGMNITQFLFSRIYLINNELGYFPTDTTVDLSQFDGFILEWETQNNILNNTK